MKTQRERWQDLPHGGAMRREADIPVAVSDKGAWQLDENRILSDAQEVSGIKLTWLHLSRALRWQKAPITAVILTGQEWSWSVAKVTLAACDSCGIEVGNRWITEANTAEQAWVCEKCAG
jgi:hypothetical protein